VKRRPKGAIRLGEEPEGEEEGGRRERRKRKGRKGREEPQNSQQEAPEADPLREEGEEGDIHVEGAFEEEGEPELDPLPPQNLDD